MANDLNAAWNYGLDQITPPIDPNENTYAYAASQTAREAALAALLAAATDRIGKLGGKGSVECPTTAAADAAKKAALDAAKNNLDKARDSLEVAMQAEITLNSKALTRLRTNKHSKRCNMRKMW